MEENFYDILNYIVDNYGAFIQEKTLDKLEYANDVIKIIKILDDKHPLIQIKIRDYKDDYWREAKITPELQDNILNIYKDMKYKEDIAMQEAVLRDKKVQRMRLAAIESSYIFDIITSLGVYEDNIIKVEEIFGQSYTKDFGKITYVKERRVKLVRSNKIVYNVTANGLYADIYQEGNWEKHLLSVYKNNQEIVRMVRENDYKLRTNNDSKQQLLIKRFEMERYFPLNSNEDI